MSDAARKISDMTEDELRAIIREVLGGESPKPEPAQTPPDPDTYIDSDAIAQRFGVCRGTVHNWVHKQGCPCLSRGKILRFRLEAVEEWLRNRPKLRKVR